MGKRLRHLEKADLLTFHINAHVYAQGRTRPQNSINFLKLFSFSLSLCQWRERWGEYGEMTGFVCGTR